MQHVNARLDAIQHNALQNDNILHSKAAPSGCTFQPAQLGSGRLKTGNCIPGLCNLKDTRVSLK